MTTVTHVSRSFLAVLFLAFIAASVLAAEPGARPDAVPMDPIEGILQAFRARPLVAISEGIRGHGDDPGHAFLRVLIQEPRFAETVNDIVVEFGSARYQGVMDRYVRGDDVPQRELERVWHDTTGPAPTWDVPVFAEFYRMVRMTNRSLPRDRQLRVLLGEPPLDWNAIENYEEYVDQLMNLGNRDGHAAQLIQREVLARGRRALIIYGGMHLQRRNLFANYGADWPDADTLVMHLERHTPNSVFTIWRAADLDNLQRSIASWEYPKMTIIKGTTLGAVDFSKYYAYGGERRIVREGRPLVVPRAEWRSLPMEEQFDAVMSVGPLSSITYSKIPRELCSNSEYLEMRLRRLTLLRIPEEQIDSFKRHCDAQ